MMIAGDASVLIQPSNCLLDHRRFYVLLIFAFLAFNQCWIWLTFSPVARSTEQFYHISEAAVDLLLNWGPIIFIPCLPITYVLLNRPNGLQNCVVLLAILDFFAALIRVVPAVITDPSSPNFSRISMIFLHLGQIINAACGPLVMAPVSQLSCLWFAPHERTRATTIAVFANTFGLTAGFLLNPWIVSSPAYVPRLLYVHLAVAFLACVLALLFFPSAPRHPPSAAATLLLRPQTSTQSWKDLKQCLIKPSFLLIAGAGGLMSGAFSTWTSLFDLILKSENYSEQQAGWFGFGSSLAGIFGGLVFSSLADTPRFRRSLKPLILLAFTGCFLSILWFELSVRTLFYDHALIPSNAVTIALSTGLVGLCAGAACPLIYEALAELMYPLPESLSASILVQWVNVIGLIMLFIAPNRAELINFLVFISIFLCIALVSFARFTYQRSDEDARRKSDETDEQRNYGTSS